MSPDDWSAAEEAPLSAAESLALIAEQDAHVRRQVRLDPAVLYLLWALAWGIGFLLSFLAYGPDRVVPAWLGVATPTVLIAAAMVFTFGYSTSVSRGVAGRSRTTDTMYGWSWALGFGGLIAVDIALSHQGLSARQAASLWSGSSLLLVGLLHLAGGALYRSAVTYALGVWTLLSGVAAAVLSAPGSYLVLSLAGGGGFLLLAGWIHWHARTSA